MQTFQNLLNNIHDPAQHKTFRLSLISEIETHTKRPLIVYVANFSAPVGNAIDFDDKTGFSDLIDGIPEGPLDVFIHSPGGSAEAAEQIVLMLRSRFPKDIRFIVPNLAKSAATMMVLSGNTVVMDYRSELGPIDPQIPMPVEGGGMRYVPADTVLNGFATALEYLKNLGPEAILALTPLLRKYDLHLFEICSDAKKLAVKLTSDWLFRYMCEGNEKAKALADKAALFFADHERHLTHARPIGIDAVNSLGLCVFDLAADPVLQDKIWTLYLAYDMLFNRAPAIVKLYENSRGISWSRQIQQVVLGPIPQPPAQPPAAPPQNPQGTPPANPSPRKS